MTSSHFFNSLPVYFFKIKYNQQIVSSYVSPCFNYETFFTLLEHARQFERHLKFMEDL